MATKKRLEQNKEKNDKIIKQLEDLVKKTKIPDKHKIEFDFFKNKDQFKILDISKPNLSLFDQN